MGQVQREREREPRRGEKKGVTEQDGKRRRRGKQEEMSKKRAGGGADRKKEGGLEAASQLNYSNKSSMKEV